MRLVQDAFPKVTNGYHWPVGDFQLRASKLQMQVARRAISRLFSTATSNTGLFLNVSCADVIS